METTLAPEIEQTGPFPVKTIRTSSSLYAWYCLFVLLGIYVNSFLDRSILALLVGPIRTTVGLSDSQMGFLMGPAFAVFYTIAGLPLGWLADRMSRLTLIAIGQVFWTVSTVAFGLGRTWTHLAVARCNVGIGEATLTPSAHSLIADLFPPNQIGRAMSVYGMGIYLGSGLASLIGGLLTQGYQLDRSYALPFMGEHLGWQIIFFIVALPTIPLTLLLLTLREPARKSQVMAFNAAGEKAVLDVPFSMFVSYVWKNRGTLFCHTFGFACLALSGYGAAAWMPEFFIRIHGWSPSRAGTLIGLANMLAGPLGILLGGMLGDKLAQRGRLDSKMRVSMYAALAWLPFGMVGPLLPSGELAYMMMIPALFFSSMHWGIAPAAIQEIMPNQMRGQASALYLFVISLIGLGLGPMLLALVTDYVFQDDRQIHYSLLLTTATATFLGILALALGLRRYRESRTRYELWLKDCS